MKQFFILERVTQTENSPESIKPKPYYQEQRTDKQTKERYTVWTYDIAEAAKFSDPNHATNAAIEVCAIENGTPAKGVNHIKTLPEKPWAFKINAYFQ
jgi:hypothetical protein